MSACSELIAQNHPRTAGGDLMVNVDAIGDQSSPIRNPALVDDEIDRVRAVPGFEEKMLVEVFVPRGRAAFERRERLIDQEKFLFEIETQAASAAQRSFVDSFAISAQARIQELRGIREREKRCDSGTTFDQAKSDRHHCGQGNNESDFAALFHY